MAAHAVCVSGEALVRAGQGAGRDLRVQDAWRQQQEQACEAKQDV